MDINRVLLISLIAHTIFLVYGLYQDANFPVKYTDIDYAVFTDAARLVYHGLSPYDRHTYRYTPLIAYLMLPNLIFPITGKVIFMLGNLFGGWALHSLLAPSKHCTVLTALWLLNPMAIQIATRGSADCLPASLVLLTLLYLRRNQLYLAGIFYGLAVHLKIYPIIHVPIFVLYLWYNHSRGFLSITNFLLNPAIWKFGLTSLTVFATLNSIFYLIYGWPFLYETYLYHGSRIDHRHNFSVFYPLLYMAGKDTTALTTFVKWGTIAQFAPVMLMSIAFWPPRLELVCFLQTLLFVAFNRVITSQYFIWWLALLPLALQTTKIRPFWLCIHAGHWIAAQALWLYFAYRLEFLGQPTYNALGISGTLLLLSHTIVALHFIIT